MRAQSFCLGCLGVLLLVVAYSVGASRAGAQASGTFVGIGAVSNGASQMVPLAITSNGDLYARNASLSCDGPQLTWHDYTWPCGEVYPVGWQYVGNVQGGSVSTTRSSWSAVKRQFGK